ncbi:hypothetical protein, partial [Mycobacteroides abscessus]|uniref:hypothetical protein n=1 Tax=Mycobacteroides abscessus TaxID=36809 RepID=UPI001C2C5951
PPRPSPPSCSDASWASQQTVPSAYLHPRFQGQEPPGFPGRFSLRPAPEFEQWLHAIGMVDDDGRLTPFDVTSSPLRALTISGAR